MEHCPNYNLILNVEDVTDKSGPIVEPVTVEEAKQYMRIEGWEESGQFDYDDLLIERLITACRQEIESYTGITLVDRSLEVTFTNGCGLLELPGPVKDGITFEKDGEPKDVDVIGTLWPKVKTVTAETVAKYDVGYTAVPDGLKTAVLAQVAYRYEHRGDETNTSGLSKEAVRLARPFQKVFAWG